MKMRTTLLILSLLFVIGIPTQVLSIRKAAQETNFAHKIDKLLLEKTQQWIWENPSTQCISCTFIVSQLCKFFLSIF